MFNFSHISNRYSCKMQLWMMSISWGICRYDAWKDMYVKNSSFNSTIKVSLHLIRKNRNNCLPNAECECGPHHATVSGMQIGENLASCRTIRTFFIVQMRYSGKMQPRLVRNRLAVTSPVSQMRNAFLWRRTQHNVHRHAPATLTRKPLQPDER